MKISFIQPSRNNLKYLKWSYESIRKNQGDHEVEICVADDFSTDGTWEWCQKKAREDSNFKYIRNGGPERVGHTILYDRLINEVATRDVAIIFHADMYLCPGALDSIEEHIKPGTIVSLTRIEPPLHPDGPEKVLRNFGTEPEDFPEEDFLTWFSNYLEEVNDETTDGIFAPWAFYRKDFQEIGGHDPLFAPQSKEDSDIFNRFLLNGVNFIQTWKGYVYHMTCRGSRFNPTITTVGKESNEWLKQNEISTRNFIRKWGHFVKHTPLMHPIVPPKYDIQIRLFNSTLNHIRNIEPWCSRLVIDQPLKEQYLEKEQPRTRIDLSDKILYTNEEIESDIIIRLDGNKLDMDTYRYINNISEIIQQTNETGQFELGNMKLTIYKLQEYQNNLIHL